MACIIDFLFKSELIKLRLENAELRRENEELRRELAELRREYHVPLERVTSPCPICLEELRVPGIHVRTPCWHFYHTECWRRLKHLGLRDECAVCRAVMGKCMYACVHDSQSRCAAERAHQDCEGEDGQV